MKKIILNIITALVLIGGVSVMTYPFLSDWYNSYHQGKAINNYKEVVDKTSKEKIAKMLADAKKYNEELLGRVELTDPFDPRQNKESSENYLKVLNVDGKGLIGEIRIPKIKVGLPIYHSTSDESLEKGAGHLERTSFPIGGANTHSVISAHTGSPKAEFFTNLIKVKKGDEFYIDVLDKTLAYQVDQIKVVNPDNTKDLRIEKDKDYVTLVTCTPYGINSHRLLVRGHRVKYVPEKDKKASKTGVVFSIRLVVMIVCLGLLILSIIAFLIIRHKTRVKRV
ncbi:MAG: class C sortase [Lachnospiraceae bacterium]|jgi:sortase A|nr:class C sortase [Lachnospiraceae bacterium]